MKNLNALNNNIKSVISDIAGRKKAEEKIEQILRAWETTFNSIKDLVWIQDKDFKLLRVNKAFADTVKMRPEELIGKTCYEVVHGTKTPWPNCIHKRIMNSKKSVIEEIFEPRLGIHLELSGAPIFDEKGEVAGSVHIAKDITARKKAEEKKEKLLYDIDERAKELNCLYGLSKLVEKPNVTLDETLQGMVNLIPYAWQYPDITCARIIFEDKEFKTDNFKITKWKQQADIKVHGKKAGVVEVYCLGEKDEGREELFINEERNLLEAIAERLGKIVELKKAEEAIRKAKDFSESLIASMQDGFSVLDNNGVHLDVNVAFCQMTGFSKEELIGAEPPHLYWPEEEYENIEKAFQETFRGKFEDFELIFKRKNGERFPVIVSPSWIKDKQENVINYFATIKDITGRKKAEDALRESEAFNKALFEYNPIETIVVDHEGKITMFNLAKKNSGDRLPNIGDVMYKDYGSKHKIDMYAKLMKCMKSGKPKEFPEMEYGDKFLSITIAPSPGGAIITSKDITKHKQVDEAIKRKLEFETTIYNISSRFISISGLISASSDIDKAIDEALADMGKLSGASRAYLFLIREDGTTMDNTHEWCAKGVSPQINNLKNVPSNMAPWWMGKLNKGEIIQIEDVSKLPQEAKAEKEILGRQDIKSVLVLPIVIGGKLAGFVGFDNVMHTGKWSEDNLMLLGISSEIIGNAIERKRAEERINQEKKKSEELLVELDSAYKELEATQDEILRREKIATTGALAAGVAHEIRNPLAIIGMTVQYLQSKLGQNDPKRELTEAIIKKVERLDRVTKELSSYGRTVKLNIKKHNLKRCLNMNLALIKPKCRVQRIKIKKHYSILQLIKMDDEQMDKLFLNIMDNAVQAMSKGGVLSVFAEFDKETKMTVIKIHNTGSVISKKHMPHIFEPFYTIKKRGKGTGLGLSIAQSIVLRHGGQITVENKSSGKDKGVTFIINLPPSPPPPLPKSRGEL